jgi:hypothetical protein
VKARVKLLGTLPAHYDGSYSAEGIELSLPEDATLIDVVERIGIPRERLGIITINGSLAKAPDAVPEGAEVKFFQKIAGG